MPDIGYLHSGFEKLGESLDYNQYVTVTDRMNTFADGQQRGLAPGGGKLMGDRHCRRDASISA